MFSSHPFSRCLPSIPNKIPPPIPPALFSRFLTTGFVLSPIWFTQGCLWDHCVATIPLELVGSPVGTQLKAMLARLPASHSGQSSSSGRSSLSFSTIS